MNIVAAPPPSELNVAARERLVAFERHLAELPQVDPPVRHYFADGVYCREIRIKAGIALVGYIHMQECVTILSAGRIVISDGQRPVILEAPFSMPVAAGTKKAGYVLIDTVWTDCYANPDNERRIDVLEARLTADTHEEFRRRLEKA